MFHLSDLLAAACPPPWEPPHDEPVSALPGRYRRRSFATKPDDAPRLLLPDAKYLDRLTRAALESGAEPRLAAAVIAASLEAPVLAYASSLQPDGTRSWRRLAMLSDPGCAGLLLVRGTPKKRGVVLEEVTLRIAELSDVGAVRLMVEEIHIHGDRPHRDVLDRGRAKSPRAVWLGLPGQGPSQQFARQLAAIAAVDGYVLETMGGVNARARDVLARTADLAPELVLVWAPHVPKGDFAARVRSVVRDAVVEAVEASTPLAALEEARVWFTLVPVVARVPSEAATPATLAEVAESAAKSLRRVIITDQAKRRAKFSPFESPKAVLDALRTLDEIASTYAEEGLGSGGFEEACAERGLRYSGDISRAAREKHARSYEVDWRGDTRMMGPHLRFGDSWDPRFSARVYWWVDREKRQLVVGHIGTHLPGGNE